MILAVGRSGKKDGVIQFGSQLFHSLSLSNSLLFLCLSLERLAVARVWNGLEDTCQGWRAHAARDAPLSPRLPLRRIFLKPPLAEENPRGH